MVIHSRRLLLPIAIRLHYVLSTINSTDPTLKVVNTVILTQVQLTSAIVSATIPCLRPFMAATYTTWGGRVDTVSGSGYHKRGNTSGQADDSSHSHGTTMKSFFSRQMDRSMDDKVTEPSHDIALEPIGTRRKKESQGWKQIGNSTQAEANDQFPPTTAEGDGDRYKSKGRKRHVQEDQQSAGSQESQQMIIRRDVEWTVRYE